MISIFVVICVAGKVLLFAQKVQYDFDFLWTGLNIQKPYRTWLGSYNTYLVLTKYLLSYH